jgi:hypothetical protein
VSPKWKEKMSHIEAAENLERAYDEILVEFQQVLARRGFGDFIINSVEFFHRPSLTLSTSPCPPGTLPRTKCVAKPGGGVHCFTVCR